MIHMNYFRDNEANQFTFYRIPKELFINECFRELSTIAKLLYGLMLDRMGLSLRNGWFDEQGRAYIYFTLEDAIELLDVSHCKATELFKELEAFGLIRRKRQGQGRPTRIYVMNFATAESASTMSDDAESCENPEAKTAENGKSRLLKTSGLDCSETDANKNEKNKTEFSDINPSFDSSTLLPETGSLKEHDGIGRSDDYSEQIRANIDYKMLLNEFPSDGVLIECCICWMIEICNCPDKVISFGGYDIPTEQMRSKLLSLDQSCLRFTVKFIKEKFKRPISRNVVLATLYSSPYMVKREGGAS